MASPASKRRKLNGDVPNGSSASAPGAAPESILTPATNEEKSRWGGFCEIENDPVRIPATTCELAER